VPAFLIPIYQRATKAYAGYDDSGAGTGND
jgi:hypothetical protein